MLDVYEAKGVSPGRGSFDMSSAPRRWSMGRDAGRGVLGSTTLAGALRLQCHRRAQFVSLGMGRAGPSTWSAPGLEHNSVLRPLHHLATREPSRSTLSVSTRGGLSTRRRGARHQTEDPLRHTHHGSNVSDRAAVERIAALRGKGRPLILT
jgi:hypothetical protein